MHPKMVPVTSSNIDGYLHLTDQTLVVAFNSGSYYRYNDVPDSVVEDFSSASSKGKFLNQQIKAIYDFEEVPYDQLDVLVSTHGVVMGGQNTVTTLRLNLSHQEIAELYRRYPVMRIMF